MITCKLATGHDMVLGNQWLSIEIKREFPLDFHPDTAVVAYSDQTPVVVIPIYIEECRRVAVLGHCMTNPAVPGKLKHEAVGQLLEYACRYVKMRACKYLLGYFGNRAINRIARKRGFLLGDSNVEQLIMIVR